MSTDDLTMRVALLKVVSDYTTDKYNEARAAADAVMGAGDRKVVRSPIDDSKLGAVSKSDPKTVCLIVDTAAFTEWMVENYPEKTRAKYEVIGTHQELVGVLFEHAPHLLRRNTEVTPDAIAEVKQASVFIGSPVGPGGEADIPGVAVDAPDGVVKCVPDKLALPIVQEMFRAGLIELDGTLRPQLENHDG